MVGMNFVDGLYRTIQKWFGGGVQYRKGVLTFLELLLMVIN